jgi:hypothetical protein
MSLLTYNDFLLEGYSVHHEQESKKALLIACADVAGASIEEKESLSYFINEGYVNELFDLASDINESSFAEKFKQLAINAKEKIKEKGKDYVKKLGDKTQAALKFGGNLLAPLKMVLGKIKEVIKKAWDIAKDQTKAAVEKAKEKIREKIKPLLQDSDKRKRIIEELKNLQAMASSSVKWLGGGFIDAIEKSGEKAAITEESEDYFKAFESAFYYAAAETLYEGYTLESVLEELALFEEEHGKAKGGIHIPFISSVLSKLAHTPPFSAFHKIEDAVAAKAEKGLNAFSVFMTKVASAPGPFEFPVIAGLVGIAAGYLAETQFKKGLLDLQSVAEKSLGIVIPGFGIIIKVLKYGGLALVIHGVINEIVGGEGKEDKEEKKEETV